MTKIADKRSVAIPPHRERHCMEPRIIEALDGREGKRIIDGTRRAAVLIPLYRREEGFFVVFTKRTGNVKHHKGQISFPGGACEDGDGGIKATALREAFEEVGIKPEDVRVLGMLDDVKSGISDYVVTPVVGLIPSPYCFAINGDEVESVIEVPLTALLEMEGKYGVEYWYRSHWIWGLTARILKQFLDLTG